MPYADRVQRKYENHPVTCTCVSCVASRYRRGNLFFRWHVLRWLACAILLVGLLGIPVWSRVSSFEDTTDASAWQEALLSYPEDVRSWLGVE